MLANIARRASVSRFEAQRPRNTASVSAKLPLYTSRTALNKKPFVLQYMKRNYMVPTFSADITSSEENIVISSSVADRIKELRKQDDNKNLYLRIVVDSGGCNGFLAKFELDDKDLTPEDVVINKEGAQVVLDELSLGLMKGSAIDYIDEMSRSTFVIVENPNAGTSCGCNTSFSLKDAPK